MSGSGGISSCLARYARNEIAVHRKLKLCDSGGELAPLWIGSKPRQSELSDRAQLTTDNAGEKEWHQRRLQEHWDSSIASCLFFMFCFVNRDGEPTTPGCRTTIG